jgi:hypothetical protein
MNKNYIFCVITKVPSCKERGNLYDSILVRDDKKEEGFLAFRELDEDEDIEAIEEKDLIWAKRQVFELGEILILDGEYGREVAGRGRKPYKWFVECKHFDNIEQAVECANSL